MWDAFKKWRCCRKGWEAVIFIPRFLNHQLIRFQLPQFSTSCIGTNLYGVLHISIQAHDFIFTLNPVVGQYSLLYLKFGGQLGQKFQKKTIKINTNVINALQSLGNSHIWWFGHLSDIDSMHFELMHATELQKLRVGGRFCGRQFGFNMAYIWGIRHWSMFVIEPRSTLGLALGDRYSLSEISQITNIPKGTISDIKKRKSPLNKPRSGRSSKLSERHKRQIVFHITKNQISSIVYKYYHSRSPTSSLSWHP
jgi:hypothetical protein